jgi:hypothetical protein
MKMCNQCGESCASPHHPYHSERDLEENAYGLIDAKVRGHYCSYALDDMHDYTFSLCEACLMKLFSGFKTPVEKVEYTIGQPLTEEQRAEMQAHFNSPAEKTARHLLQIAVDLCPDLDTNPGSVAMFIGPDLWATVKSSSLVSETDTTRCGTTFEVGKLYDHISLWCDPGLVDNQCRVNGRLVSLETDAVTPV